MTFFSTFFNPYKQTLQTALIVALFSLGGVMAPMDAQASNSKTTAKQATKIKVDTKTQKNNKSTIVANPNFGKKGPLLEWTIAAKTLDTDSALQENTFITENEVSNFPFMQYDSEENSFTGNSKANELERMQFTLTTQMAGNNRETAISLVSGSFAKKQTITAAPSPNQKNDKNGKNNEEGAQDNSFVPGEQNENFDNQNIATPTPEDNSKSSSFMNNVNFLQKSVSDSEDASAQKTQSQKYQITGGQGLAGVVNKATFVHICNRSTQTFNIKKIKFYVSCKGIG